MAIGQLNGFYYLGRFVYIYTTNYAICLTLVKADKHLLNVLAIHASINKYYPL